MKKKYIIVKGAAGLGNRLITLTTAITYAKRTHRQIIVDWAEGQFFKKGENAFFQCFDLVGVDYKEEIDDIENLRALTVYPKVWKEVIYGYNYKFRYTNNIPSLALLLQRMNLRGGIAKIGGFWQLREAAKPEPNIADRIRGVLSSASFAHASNFSYNRKEDIIVYLDFQPPKFEVEDFLKHIALKPHIQNVVQEYTHKLNLSNNAVGIHVRSTDKMPTKDISTIIGKVKKLGLTDPQIFLATDNSEIYRSLKKDFPKLFSFSEDVPPPPASNKGIHHHFNDETSYEMFKQSVVDMWLLSKCQYLFWQGNSSFSLISKYLHKNKSNVFDWMAD